MGFQLTLPDLEERFLPPPNWEVKSFTNPETGHDIYYRTALVENATATIICLPGLSEYGEKYIETARFFNQHNYNVFVIDWVYQGFSTRLKENRHKRHSDGYNSDISDLHYLITEKTNNNSPIFFLAHSMGAHISLRYAAKHPNTIKAIATSAPMVNIKAAKYIGGLAYPIISALKPIHNKYVLGGKDWHEKNRLLKNKNIFTNDPIREEVHNAWCIKNPDLQIGNPTYKWLIESLKSICILKDTKTLQKITCPVLLTCAGQEKLVDNDAILRAAKYLPDDKLIYIEHAKHEILMEKDDIRNQFLNETLKLFNQ